MNITERKLVQINVDVQNDFCPGGALAVPKGDEVIQPLNTLAHVVREKGGIVIATQDFHPEQTSHFEQWPVHCVAGTEGAEFHPGLEVKDVDVVVQKGTEVDEDAYSGFDGKDRAARALKEIVLPDGEIKQVNILIGGLATDYCVKATVLDALELAKDNDAVTVYALVDAMRAVNIKETDGKEALVDMGVAGARLITTENAINRINRGEL